MSRTSHHGSLWPGVSSLATVVLSRCTRLLDRLAPRYRRPFPCSVGVTLPQRSYDPVRLPPWPASYNTVEAATLAAGRVSPDDPHHPSDVPCPLPRRIERVHVSIASPLARPSPNGRRVGIRIVTLIACSGFTHVTAHRIAQPPYSDLCHEAPARPVTRPNRSSATRSIDNSLGGILLHW